MKIAKDEDLTRYVLRNVPSVHFNGDSFNIINEGEIVHLELIIANIADGVVRYKIDDGRVKDILAMYDAGVPIGLLIGIKGSWSVIFAVPAPKILSGEWSMRDQNLERYRNEFQVRSDRGFWSGVNFIFSEMVSKRNLSKGG